MEWYTSEIGGEVRRNDNDPDLERPVATGKYRLASYQVLSYLLRKVMKHLKSFS